MLQRADHLVRRGKLSTFDFEFLFVLEAQSFLSVESIPVFDDFHQHNCKEPHPDQCVKSLKGAQDSDIMRLLEVSVEIHRRNEEIRIDDIAREEGGMLDEKVPHWFVYREQYFFHPGDHLEYLSTG
jgi:hypothetical protein